MSPEEYDNKYDAAPSIEDLMAEDDDLSGEFIQEAVNLKTGISNNIDLPKIATPSRDPNATRWLFNPFEVIDLRNEPASCGMPWLKNVVFNRVSSIAMNIQQGDSMNLPDSRRHNPGNYNSFQRTAEMIADELTAKHGMKGVVEVKDLTGQSDDTAENLNLLLFGSEVECVVDVNNPDFPCPVLPNLLELMEHNVRTNTATLDAASKEAVFNTARALRKAIVDAIRNARARIDEAQRRLLDEKNPNRMLSHAEQRCYLALGEEIPNQMPYLAKSQAAAINGSGGGGFDGDALAKAVVAGVRAAMPQTAPNVTVTEAPAAPVASDTSFETIRTFSIGDRVLVNDQKAIVIAKPFGKVKVEFESGETATVDKDQIA